MYNGLLRLSGILQFRFFLCVKGGFAQIPNSSTRQRLLIDHGWISFGHPYDIKKDFDHATNYFSCLAKGGYGNGSAAEKFDDRSWKNPDLPLDWAVEQNFSQYATYSHCFRAIGSKFPKKNIGWYRKKFNIPASDLGPKISVDFDGVLRNSKVWINGLSCTGNNGKEII